MRKRRVVILGATGSIGQSAAKVARDIPERMEIIGMSGHRNTAALAQLAVEFPDATLCVTDENADLSKIKNQKSKILAGEAGLIELATLPEADMVLIAIVGIGGLRPALAAIEAGKDIAVASKEILVMAGEAVMSAAKRRGIKVLPVDSEHNAIFQCLEGRVQDSVFSFQERNPSTANSPENCRLKTENSHRNEIRRLILTASGGPFRKLPADQLAGVTVEQALKHPTWKMGRKITIDSATLFNKGLEMIEARWLFDVEMARVDVIVHPQSIVHSMVEFVDGSVLAQLSHSDMCFPIQYAVTWPERVANRLRPIDFAALAKLEFEAPRFEDFPALALARHAGETGGTLPSVMNAANEVAVDAFLHRKISFPGIWQTVQKVMEAHASIAHPSLDAIVEADSAARLQTRTLIGQ